MAVVEQSARESTCGVTLRHELRWPGRCCEGFVLMRHQRLLLVCMSISPFIPQENTRKTSGSTAKEGWGKMHIENPVMSFTIR